MRSRFDVAVGRPTGEHCFPACTFGADPCARYNICAVEGCPRKYEARYLDNQKMCGEALMSRVPRTFREITFGVLPVGAVPMYDLPNKFIQMYDFDRLDWVTVRPHQRVPDGWGRPSRDTVRVFLGRWGSAEDLESFCGIFSSLNDDFCRGSILLAASRGDRIRLSEEFGLILYSP